MPALGKIRLQRLSPQQVQALLNSKLAEGLSSRTVQYIRAVLRRALGQALKWGLVARNAATLVDSPRVEHHEIQALNVKEAKKLLKALRGHRLEALFTIALALGLRQGEVLGLRWQDVDFKKRQLRVQVLHRIEKEYRLAEPKTQKGKRTLDLPDQAHGALRRRRLIQQEEKLVAGSRWQERWGLVFTTRGGRPLEGPRITPRLQEDSGGGRVFRNSVSTTCVRVILAGAGCSTASRDGVSGAQPNLVDDEHLRARHACTQAGRGNADEQDPRVSGLVRLGSKCGVKPHHISTDAHEPLRFARKFGAGDPT